MKAHATLNYLRISPRKTRVVADVVRGMNAQEAVAQLSFNRRRASEPIRTLIASAIANAEHNHGLDPETLTVASITVNDGPTFKRFRPKGMGRAGLIERKTSHISVVLEGERAAGGAPQKKKGKPAKAEEKPSTAPGEISEGEADERDERSLRQTQKKMGKQKEDSFVKKIFRRKSI